MNIQAVRTLPNAFRHCYRAYRLHFGVQSTLLFTYYVSAIAASVNEISTYMTFLAEHVFQYGYESTVLNFWSALEDWDWET